MALANGSTVTTPRGEDAAGTVLLPRHAYPPAGIARWGARTPRVRCGCATLLPCFWPGEVYSNATDAVEWIVPRTVMTQLVIANETLRRRSFGRSCNSCTPWCASQSRTPKLPQTVLESVRVGSVKRIESDDRGKTPKRVLRRFARLRTTTISLRAPLRFAIAPPPHLLRLRRPRWRGMGG